MKPRASVECGTNGVVIVSDVDFLNERDRFNCVIAVAVGLGLSHGMDSGEILREVQVMLDRAFEHNAESIEAIRRGSPGGLGGVGVE